MALEIADVDPIPSPRQRIAAPETSGVRRSARAAASSSVMTAGVGTTRVLVRVEDQGVRVVDFSFKGSELLIGFEYGMGDLTVEFHHRISTTLTP